MEVLTRPAARTMSSLEYERLPEDARYELLRGELIEMPPTPGGEHGRKTGRLHTFVDYFVWQNDLGDCHTAETGFLLERNPDTVLAPDFAFVGKWHFPLEKVGVYFYVVPDIIMETRSPSQSRREMEDKIALWLHSGGAAGLADGPCQQTLPCILTVARCSR